MAERDTKTENAALLMAVATSFISTFMGSSLNLAIPSMEAEFGISGAMAGWIVTAYVMTVAAIAVPMGKLADATGRRRILLGGVGSFGVLSVCCSLVADIRILLILRVLQGFAAAMLFATSTPILLSVFPGSERGRVLGISTAAVYIGLSIGPVLGGFLNYQFGWRSVFLFTALIAAVAFWFSWRGAPREEKRGDFQLDPAGTVFFITGILAFLFGLTSLTTSRYGWIVLAAGILLLILFFYVETKAEDPIIRVTMFSEDLVFTLSNLAALLNYGATFAITYLVSIFLQIVLGYSSQTAGLILICMPVVQAFIAPVSGRLSDRIPPYRIATTGMLFCVAGLVLFSFIGLDTGIAFIVAALLIEGIGFGLFSSPNTNAVMACVEKKDYGVANSILSTMRNMGHTSSMSIVTIVVGLYLGNASLEAAEPQLLISTMHTIFLINIVLCLIGVAFSLARKKQGANT